MTTPSLETDPLATTRPLADPLRILTILAIGGGILCLLNLSILAIALQRADIFLQGLGGACAVWGMAILIAPGGKPNAIYLRAFRTDEWTFELRRELAAALGPQYRLAGIRPPRRRHSTLVRFVAPGLVALSYAGSHLMELEAGDDWMARLWKTYQSVRLVFIDVRSLTEHVHREIRMTLETMGPERCILIVSPKRSEAQWRTVISEIAGNGMDPSAFHLLEVSDESIRQGTVLEKVKALANQLPPGCPNATDRGRAFVVANVTPKELKNGRRVHPADVFGALAGIAILVEIGRIQFASMAGAGFGSLDPSVLNVAMCEAGLPLTAVVVAMIIGSVRNAQARANRLTAAGHVEGAQDVRKLISYALMLFGGAALTLLLSFAMQLSALLSSVNSG